MHLDGNAAHRYRCSKGPGFRFKLQNSARNAARGCKVDVKGLHHPHSQALLRHIYKSNATI